MLAKDAAGDSIPWQWRVQFLASLPLAVVVAKVRVKALETAASLDPLVPSLQPRVVSTQVVTHGHALSCCILAQVTICVSVVTILAVSCYGCSPFLRLASVDLCPGLRLQRDERGLDHAPPADRVHQHGTQPLHTFRYLVLLLLNGSHRLIVSRLCY